MKFFWVNKQDKYKLRDGTWLPSKNGMLSNYLWAPQKDKGGNTQHHWEILKDINIGDIIFVSVGNQLTAFAKAIKPFCIVEAPNSLAGWDGLGYKVEVEYRLLDNPLKVNKIYEEVKYMLPDKYCPFTSLGKKNQGYCYELGNAGNLIFNKYIASSEFDKSLYLNDNSQAVFDHEPYEPINIESAKKLVLRAISLREGQPVFRNTLLEIYEGRCAITGTAAIDVLEAAHILPYDGKHTNHPENGILLRADIHTLFDKGLIKIHADNYTVFIDKRLKDTEYQRFSGLRIRFPKRHLPSKDALKIRWSL